MKIHITNLYNFNPNDKLVKRQHCVADAGISLGYREMGIFSYPVETDSYRELSTRLDGIIAALEAEDVVFLQLPTKNGSVYEILLAQKCKAYRNTKLILFIHDTQLLVESNEINAQYGSLFRMSDAVIVPSERDIARVKAHGGSVVIAADDIWIPDDSILSDDVGYNSLCQSDFYLKKVLMDAVAAVYAPQNEMVRLYSHKVQDEIQIGFGLHDKDGNYSVWVGVAMQSVIEHTSAPICFHILHDATLNQQNKRRLIQVATQKGNRIWFHALDAAMWEESKQQMDFYTIGALFRIKLPECLSEMPRIIYLDADVFVNRDIKELWNMNIQDYCLAAVPDIDVVNGIVRPVVIKDEKVSAERYFNSGVLYMNLDQIRKKGDMCKLVLDYLGQNRDSHLPDQDALNVIYGSETLLLDSTWNCFVRPLQVSGGKQLENKLYHFVGTRCLLYYFSEVDWRYYETTLRTPWREEAGKNQVRRSLERVNYRLANMEKLVTQISESKKKHIFYGEETLAMKNIYNLLTIRDGDYRVLGEIAGETNSILPCRELSVLKEEKNEFVVFVLPEADHGTSIDRLEKMGLRREKDYFVIPCLLPSSQGGYA